MPRGATRSRGTMRALVTAAVAAGATVAATALVRRAMPGGPDRWQRTNHRGETIDLAEGPGLAIGLAAGSLACSADRRIALAGATAALGAGAFGLVDDLAERGSAKGLRGHLGAMAHGELTTGGLKILGIGATGLAAAAFATPRTGGRIGHVVDLAVSGALIAGTANLFNLLDLRPGRVLKASLAGSALTTGSAAPGSALGPAVLGAATAALPDDLDERTMAGDAGANALGAVLGTAAVRVLPPAGRLVLLGSVVGLTVVSERVSFTQVIARTPVLREIDGLGRRP